MISRSLAMGTVDILHVSAVFLCPKSEETKMDWMPVNENVLGFVVMGELRVAKRNQDILIRLKYHNYQAETKIVGGVTLSMNTRIRCLKIRVVELQDQLKRAGAYGIVDGKIYYQPMVEPKEKPKAAPPAHWAVIPSSISE